jgi:hypothetical protein
MRTMNSHRASLTTGSVQRIKVGTGYSGFRWIGLLVRLMMGRDRMLNRLSDLDRRHRRDLGLDESGMHMRDPIDRAQRQDALLQQARDRALLLALGHRAR